MSSPLDPLREEPLSLDEWIKSFDFYTRDEEELVRHAAATLRKNIAFKRVLNWLEGSVMRQMMQADVADSDLLTSQRMMLHGLSAIRAQIDKLAEDEDFEQKRSEK